MRPARLLGAVAAGLLAAASPVAAQGPTTAPTTGLTTAGLAEACAANPADTAGVAGVAYCRGFLIAAGQYHAELTVRPGDRTAIFCLPNPSPTVEAAQASFVAWAQANPQHAGEKALIGLMRWAGTTYPCPPAPATRPAPQRR